MEWYKTHVSLRKNAIYKRLSPLARQAFRNAMDAVADYEQGDQLALRVGKLTPKELAEDLVVPVKSLQKVLQELQSCGFFSVDSDGVWHIEKFTEKTESHAERQRRYRQNHPEDRLRRRLREYGLSREEFYAMLSSQSGSCNYCRISINEENCAIDHVIPLVAGGVTDRANLQLLCIPCNGGKSGMTGNSLDEYILRRRSRYQGSVTGSRDEGRVTELGDGSRASEVENRDKKSPNGDGKPKQPTLGVREPSDLVAWQILDAAWPVISAHHDLAIERKDWRDHNKRAAKSLANAGKTPEQVVDMLTLAYTHSEGRRWYGGITTLAKLIEHWPKLATLKDKEPDEDLMTRAIRNGGVQIY